MKHELTIFQLGKLLKDIDNEYNMNILVKNKLSGGFLTVTGKISVQYAPNAQKALKGNNIIGLTITNNDNAGMDIKITGINDNKFIIDISPTKFKEIKSSGLSINKIKENLSECKLRIGDDIIFTIPASHKTIENYLPPLETEICAICGDAMNEFDLAYDQNQYGKLYYKCDTCGHKMNIMK